MMKISDFKEYYTKLNEMKSSYKKYLELRENSGKNDPECKKIKKGLVDL